MPAKRSRIGRSTSISDTAVMSPPSGRRAAAASRVPTEGNSAKAMRSTVEEEGSGETRSRIFTVSSPVKGSEVVGPTVGFLERCYGCKKKIGDDADVFMYSYLRSFCSVECREKQILIDNATDSLLAAHTGRIT